MSEKSQQLRKSLNEVEVSGILYNSTLELKVQQDEETGIPFEVIKGDVTLQVAENELHTFSYYVKKLTKAGKENNAFKGLVTFMNESISISDIAEGLKEVQPTQHHAKGEFNLNEYKGQDGEVKSFMKLRATYAPKRHEAKNGEFKPQAKYHVEGIIKSVRPQIVNDEETGRLIADLYIVNFKGEIEPISLITDTTMKPESLSYMEDNFVKNSSVSLNGDIINFSKEETRIVEQDFGDDIVEKTHQNVREFTIRGGSLFDETSNKAFDISLLAEAISNRNRKIDTIKESENKKQESKADRVGFGNETPINTKATASTTTANDDIDDLFND